MAWNEPGGSKDNDPWGNRSKKSGPPDLDEVVRNIRRKLDGLFGGKGRQGDTGGGRSPLGGGSAGIGGVILLVVGLWLIYDMVYIIQPAERGVVLRFGQYVATLEPGMTLRMPRPLERVERVDVDKSRNVEIGFRSSGEGGKTTPMPSESLMLTRDENIIDVQFAVQYRVKSANDYLFNVKDPDLTLREATESAVREVVGQNKMDFVLTEGRSDIVARIQALTQHILDHYQTGLLVTSVNMQDAQPPDEVQHAFDDAVKAREDEQRQINEAEAYSNDILPRARGGAARLIEEAQAYKSEVIAKAEGEASRFDRVVNEYKKAPRVTRERMYLEALEEVLSKSSKVMVDVKGGNNMIYLPLDRIMEQSGMPVPQQPASTATPEAAPAAKLATPAERDTRSRERER
ncbi:MAG: FtsH protease activity modulator HflK [Gammaproteobacteria bacterium]|nr:FtsH protease activity modulator HflK [Gammaproteobacteria bacterium]